MSDNIPMQEGCPESVLRRIPWYPDQGLSELERGEVEAHAAGCEACRREIEMIQGEPVDLPAAPNREAVYAQILDRIEADAEAETGLAVPSSLGAATRASPKQAGRRLALAASLLLALGLGLVGGLLLQGSDLREPLYRTAAEPTDALAPAEGVGLDVIFRGAATAEQITAALRAIRADVVSGPSRLGVYRLMLSADGDATAAARMLLAEGTGVATFAEPVQR